MKFDMGCHSWGFLAIYGNDILRDLHFEAGLRFKINQGLSAYKALNNDGRVYHLKSGGKSISSPHAFM